eukprot:TRINITY_DN5015_c0_g3_i1.p1 TRINITY_DN5015_c0_g3~~TRINITY_DN5015_c0_g3_i1.p1  ORF type:complete len:292 (-),score=33.16 TRINITY_DN5015_c0_g3_i1:28-903(-)
MGATALQRSLLSVLLFLILLTVFDTCQALVDQKNEINCQLTDRSVQVRFFDEEKRQTGVQTSNAFSYPSVSVNISGNDAGITAFKNVITDPNNLIKTLSYLVWKKLYPNGNGRYRSTVRFILRNFSGVAYAAGDELHLSSNYISSFSKSRTSAALKSEITGVLVHELVHFYQFAGSGTPGGLVEGIADWVRAKTGYQQWSTTKTGNWDQGYGATAAFLEWVNIKVGSLPRFVIKLNAKLKSGYTVSTWQSLSGQTPENDWAAYIKTKRGRGITQVQRLKRLLSVALSKRFL